MGMNSGSKSNSVMTSDAILHYVSFSVVISSPGALTLKAPNKNCSRRHFNFLLLSFEDNKA